MVPRRCLRDPPQAVRGAGHWLEKSVARHLANDQVGAAEAIVMADVPACREWADSLWGKGGPWTLPRLPDQPPTMPGVGPREAPRALEDAVAARDGYWCRFCGIGVVRREKREAIRLAYPDALRWGGKNKDKHAGFIAMTACFDHVLPYRRGGSTNLENIILCCWPCNSGRADRTLKEVGLSDPRERPPTPRTGWEGWNGLKDFR